MARVMGKLAVALLALALLAGCGDGDDSGDTQITETPTGFDAVVGEWSGTLQQADTDPFPIEVEVESQDDPELNVVTYGGEIDCSGNWGLIGVKGEQVLFREVIDRGRGGHCKGVGTVTLTVGEDPDSLGYEFTGGGVESEGVLSRESS